MNDTAIHLVIQKGNLVFGTNDVGEMISMSKRMNYKWIKDLKPYNSRKLEKLHVINTKNRQQQQNWISPKFICQRTQVNSNKATHRLKNTWQ